MGLGFVDVITVAGVCRCYQIKKPKLDIEEAETGGGCSVKVLKKKKSCDGIHRVKGLRE